MEKYQKLLNQTRDQLLKAIDHLAYSYNKIQKLPSDLDEMDDEIMETWESFSSRFSRVADIFMMKYIRSQILVGDPGFKGTLRDCLNKAEKSELISSAKQWIEIRELRNVSAHEYNDEGLSGFYERIKSLCPILINLKDKI